MARLGFEYKVDTDTDKPLSGGGGGLLPHMYARVWAESITPEKTPDGLGYKVDITFEVQEPEEFKGRKFWANWTVVHPEEWNNKAYKFGKPRFDKLGRAVGVEIDSDTDMDDVMFRTFVAEVGIEIGNAVPGKPGEFYKDKNYLQDFFFNDDGAKVPIPELGVIGDGTQGKKRNEPQAAPANDNRPAQPDRPAAAAGGAAGRKPWGAK